MARRKKIKPKEWLVLAATGLVILMAGSLKGMLVILAVVGLVGGALYYALRQQRRRAVPRATITVTVTSSPPRRVVDPPRAFDIPRAVDPPRAFDNHQTVDVSRAVDVPGASSTHNPLLGGRGSDFYGPGTVLEVGGRKILSPLTYVSPRGEGADASTIILSLSVGRASRATPLSYWPSYADADPDQRAQHLDWLAGGRQDPGVAISYPFIFFYGLERRALVDGQDVDLARREVRRLLETYGPVSGSFRSYARAFLSFTALQRLSSSTETQLEDDYGDPFDAGDLARSGLLAWYVLAGRRLPARHAAAVAAASDDAKRGVVVERARDEIIQLFSLRYREAHGEGLALVVGKNPAVHSYRPASGTLLRAGVKLQVSLPDVMARTAQFKPLVALWNDCVEDLRKVSAAKRKAGDGILTAAVWEAMPAELRAQHDHPDLDRWTDAVAAAHHAGRYHLMTARVLANLASVPTTDKVTPAQGRRLAETAGTLGFALEPDPRLTGRPLASDAVVAVWRTPHRDLPNPQLYNAITSLMSLMMVVAAADGTLDEQELTAMLEITQDVFALTDTLRERVAALREVLSRIPPRATTIAKKLASTRSSEEVGLVGRMLVAIAGADGILTPEEHKALKGLYKTLGLPPLTLDQALVAAGLRLGEDELVAAAEGGTPSRGEAIPQPARPRGMALDPAAIAKIMADTHDVAQLLSEVLSVAEDEDEVVSTVSTPAAPSQRTSRAELGEHAAQLDLRYHDITAELLQRDRWPAAEVNGVCQRHHLMPSAVLDAINAWSEDFLGDIMIAEQGDWIIDRQLLPRFAP